MTSLKLCNQADMVAYLSCGLIKGIGPETARAIVSRFGLKSLEVLDQNPEELLSIKGIAEAKLQRIVDSYQATKAISDLMLYLAPYGVSPKRASLIREAFGDDSLRIVREDPFQLCRIKGFGFLTVDAIARKTQVSLRNPLRYSGAIAYVLEVMSISLVQRQDRTISQPHATLYVKNTACFGTTFRLSARFGLIGRM